MKVQKIKLQNMNQQQWIVVGNDYLPIEPISQYLFFLYGTKKSPNTIRTYAHHLKIYWEYITINKLDWKKINIDNLAHFIAILNGLIDGNVFHLDLKNSKRSERTINQIVVVITNFYQYHHRLGNVPELLLHQWKKSVFTHKTFKPLLHHLSKSKGQRSSIFKLKERKQFAKTIEPKIIEKMISSCRHLRDKLLICLLYETGCRIGQALGLRHEDIETFDNLIVIRPREDNANFSRVKSDDENRIHVSKDLMQLYCDYYLKECGNIDSDYVFVTLWKGEIGKPISYNTVMTLFQRLSKKLGVRITPHMFRHTHASELIRAGWGMAYVQKRLGHQDIQTTVNIYTHLTDQDLKEKYQEYLKGMEVK